MSRVTVTEDEFGGLRVIIGPLRNPAITCFIVLWGFAWLMGEFGVSARLLAALWKGESSGLPFGVLWLTVWTYAGISTCLLGFSNQFGREVVVLRGTVLELRDEVGFLVRSKDFNLAEVRNLRYSALSPWGGIAGSPVNHARASRGVRGSLAFDHGGKTYRFGRGLSEYDSRRLILTIQKYFPIEEEPLQPFPITR
jgi:hypothetical protein